MVWYDVMWLDAAVAANAAVATTAALLRLLHGQDEISAPSETGASSNPKVSTTLEPEASEGQ